MYNGIMLLDLRHWEMLLAIDDAGTVRAAAERLGLTQSALSHRLAEAERRLGGELFAREGRTLSLTPAGRLIVQSARRLLPALGRVERDARAMIEESAKLVRLGVAAYAAFHWLPDFLAWLRKEVPDISVEIAAEATQRPMRSLYTGAVDVVIAPAQLAGPATATVPLFTDELVLLVPPDHPLGARGHIEAEDLVGLHYMTYSRVTEPGFEYERFIRPAGAYPRSVSMIELTNAIVELVAAGIGASILTRWATLPDARAGRIVQVPLGTGGIDMQWGAVLRDSEPARGAPRRLAAALARWCRETPGFTG